MHQTFSMFSVMVSNVQHLFADGFAWRHDSDNFVSVHRVSVLDLTDVFGRHIRIHSVHGRILVMRGSIPAKETNHANEPFEK